MKQTAVEWLYETLWKQNNYSLPSNILEQAKEIEKEQIVKAVYYNVSSMSHDDLPAGESYYNKTFKQQEQ